MLHEIRIAPNWGARFMKITDDRIWIAGDYYGDAEDEEPEKGWSSEYHKTLGDAMQSVCEKIEECLGKEAAMEFCESVGEKLMFDELPRWVLVFAFRK